MFLIGGISSKIKQAGMAQCDRCPVCGQAASMYIIHKYMTPHIFFIPTFRFHSEYVATCQSCSGVMELDPEKGKAYRKDPSTHVYPGDLRVIGQNTRGSCNNCGGEIYPGQNYCGNCGSRV